MTTHPKKKIGRERIQIIESELRWVSDRGGVGVNIEVKAQGGGRVGAIEGAAMRPRVWLCESVRVMAWGVEGDSGEAMVVWLCGWEWLETERGWVAAQIRLREWDRIRVF